ncbi:hypothetical protein ACFSDD_10940 [Salipiger marinus]|uniref:hypothetical protein n=1 Tax=Salipiger marinus TaxID=555512 RepID=UPI002C16F54D|nr:hypothetical protein [Salipiger manganoxidans]MEB3419886.1 hypothetical protein [Salipiger manganoxidans]
MSFESELLAHLGGADDAWDIQATVRRCFFFDFDGAPTRLWDGVGLLTTTTGVGDPLDMGGRVLAANEWLGTRDGFGLNAMSAPEIRDDRDGVAPDYVFGIPKMDRDTFDALKADQTKVKGRQLVIYDVIIPEGEGLLPQQPIRFNARLTMRGADFREMARPGDGGEIIMTYAASVTCRSGEAGRSRYPGGTYTDTSQRDRARLLGLESDSGCVFVAKNSQRTFRVG